MVESRWSGLKDLSPTERKTGLVDRLYLDENTLACLEPAHGLDTHTANIMVENVIGIMGIPVGIASNLTVDGEDVLVPMATEEASVIAAASNASRWARETGGVRTSSTGPVMQAQIQILDSRDPLAAKQRVLAARAELIDAANTVDPVLVQLGGGCTDVLARVVDTNQGVHLVVHLCVDVRDAMGANAVNSMAETLAPRLAELAQGRACLRILSNLADHRLVRAHATFHSESLGGDAVVDDMLAAAALAHADPYRAATHNKGIMNGISALVLATGNDTRAVEAGAHAYAAASGQYRSLSFYERTRDGDLSVSLELPLAVGLVGGATRSHPVAQANLQILKVRSADHLSRIAAALGLVENVASMRALAAEGIQHGHMRLHARSMALRNPGGADF